MKRDKELWATVEELVELVNKKEQKKSDKVFAYFVGEDKIPFDWSFNFEPDIFKKKGDCYKSLSIDVLVFLFLCDYYHERNPFGLVLTAHRMLEGMTMSELAEKMEVNKSTIVRWEKTEVKPSIENALKLASILSFAVTDYTEKSKHLN